MREEALVAEPTPVNPLVHVLLVEDDPAQLEDIRVRLEGMGCRVTPAMSAESALRLAEQGGFDVILTDNVLPGITGLQALPRFKASGASVALMTSQYNPETEKDALLLGAEAFLRKPLATEDLSALIQNTAKNARSRRAR